MHVEVSALRYADIAQSSPGESSQAVRNRVIEGRRRQYLRFKSAKTNAQLSSSELKAFCSIDQECQELLRQAIDMMGISARACYRLIRVARTIADLDASLDIRHEHLLEAINFRNSQLENPIPLPFSLH